MKRALQRRDAENAENAEKRGETRRRKIVFSAKLCDLCASAFILIVEAA